MAERKAASEFHRKKRIARGRGVRHFQATE